MPIQEELRVGNGEIAQWTIVVEDVLMAMMQVCAGETIGGRLSGHACVCCGQVLGEAFFWRPRLGYTYASGLQGPHTSATLKKIF